MTVSTERPEAGPCPEADIRLGVAPLPGVVTEEERTLLGIRQARDLVLGKNRELIDKLGQAEDQIAELTYERDDGIVARDAALKKAADLAAEVDHLRAQIVHLTEQKSALGEAEKIYVLARAEIEEDLLTAMRERDEAVVAWRTGVIEKESLRVQLAEAQAATGQPESATGELEDTLRQLNAARQEHERFAAQQKKFIATLAEQLSTVQRANQENRRLVEQLESERDPAVQRATEEKAALETRISALEAQLAAPSPGQPNTAATGGVTPLPCPPPPVLSDQEVRDAIGSLFLQFEEIKAQPARLELLAAFESSLHRFAASTRVSGLDLIHHFASTGGELAARLRAAPGKLPTAIPSFDRAFEMLGWLGLRGRAAILEARGALVYAVDDDVDNCECIAAAFEKIELQTKYAVRPEIALQQIAAYPCELIVLDVDLPGMDGFELHARIRQLPSHASTPIVFLSGHLSTIERLEALGGENNEFVAKPYNLSELSLRALTLIVEARLG